jgi:FtsH-binding integral membrane protein
MHTNHVMASILFNAMHKTFKHNRRFAASDVIYSSLAAGLFSLFIVYDTQRVIGGKHRIADQIDRKDWALGSVTLYLDIITLFLELLRLFGQKD